MTTRYLQYLLEVDINEEKLSEPSGSYEILLELILDVDGENDDGDANVTGHDVSSIMDVYHVDTETSLEDYSDEFRRVIEKHAKEIDDLELSQILG